ncbi:hypothetical protein KKA69_02135 [Patescibacteria group bacterium]|nr:hypothetical protein [Patescibacteria group bacterium]
MKKKIIIGTIGMGLLLATIGIYYLTNLAKKTTSQKEISNQPIKIVNAEEVVYAPDHYKGFLGVEGKVIKVDESKSIFFLLGCEDACATTAMPVKYNGQMPKEERWIIVYGELGKQEDGRYIFLGKEVKTK